MRILASLASVTALSSLTTGSARLPQAKVHASLRSSDGRVTLHNGWRLTPAGRHFELPGDMPGSIIVAPGGRFLFVNTCGYHGHSVSVFDTRTEKFVQRIGVVRDWVGMAYEPESGTLFVSGAGSSPYKPKRGGDKIVGGEAVPETSAGALLRFSWDGSRLTSLPGMALPEVPEAKRFVSGIAAAAGGTLCVLNSQTDELIVMTQDGPKSRAKLGFRPYGVAISRDGARIAVSNWGSRSVTILSASDLSTAVTVNVGPQPEALAFSTDGRLFVANSGSDTVSVIDGDQVKENVRVSPMPGFPTGATPTALAIDRGGARLYVAVAHNNCVAVVDISRRGGESRVLGFIPTARYPSALALSADGRKLFVATGKGLAGASNGISPGAEPRLAKGEQGGFTGHTANSAVDFEYILNLQQGHLSVVDLPRSVSLRKYTAQVMANAPLGARQATSAAQRRILDAQALTKIHHVVYVIKENRTYDQVLGDDPRGNGDPRLTIFGAKATPNEHKLAKQFVLLDNLYCDGETSQVGHQWTDSAYATDFTEKAMLMSYSSRGQIEADTRLSSSPAGFIWNDAANHGKKYRMYGEYMQYSGEHDTSPEPIRSQAEKYHFSQAFEDAHAAGARDPAKVDIFIRDMRAAEKTGKAWPALMVMALPEDHTRGMRAGTHTPLAMVASNDLAVGKLVEAISHSKFWKDTAIFIIQDDAQAGPDHVDAHRTVGFVISPYVKRGTVDHTMYTTSSMLRTMEIMLRLPPMTQYDANATPMYGAFTTRRAPWLYACAAPEVDLEAMNPKGTTLALRSAKLDFSDLDRADPIEFNAILWEAYRPGIPMPAPVVGYRGR